MAEDGERTGRVGGSFSDCYGEELSKSLLSILSDTWGICLGPESRYY